MSQPICPADILCYIPVQWKSKQHFGLVNQCGFSQQLTQAPRSTLTHCTGVYGQVWFTPFLGSMEDFEVPKALPKGRLDCAMLISFL